MFPVAANLDVSRPILETAAVKTDTLPKIAAQPSTDLAAALKTYRNASSLARGGAGDSLAQRMGEGGAKRRVRVAAGRVRVVGKKPFTDGEYPYTDPASAGMRKKFDLPPDWSLNA